MARPRRLVTVEAEIRPPDPSPAATTSFTAINFGFEYRGATPMLRFYDTTGRELTVGLDPHALIIWRRFTRGNL